MKQRFKLAVSTVVCFAVMLSMTACGGGSGDSGVPSDSDAPSSYDTDEKPAYGSPSSSGSYDTDGESDYGSPSGSSSSGSYDTDDEPTYEDPITGETYTQEEMEDFVEGLSKGFESGEWDSENGFYQP